MRLTQEQIYTVWFILFTAIAILGGFVLGFIYNCGVIDESTVYKYGVDFSTTIQLFISSEDHQYIYTYFEGLENEKVLCFNIDKNTLKDFTPGKIFKSTKDSVSFNCPTRGVIHNHPTGKLYFSQFDYYSLGRAKYDLMGLYADKQLKFIYYKDGSLNDVELIIGG